MAMRAIRDLPKFQALKRALKLGYLEAMGLLEGIWHMTAKVTPRGNIGKNTDQEIMDWVEWHRPEVKAETVIAALVKYRWLDKHPRYRLCVHDWKDWADSSVKAVLRNRKQVFVQDEDDYSKLTNIPESVSGKPGCGPGAPGLAPGEPGCAPGAPDKKEYGPGTGAGAVLLPPATEAEFLGRAIPPEPDEELPQRGLGEYDAEIQEKAARLQGRFIKRCYGTEANVPATYKRLDDARRLASALEFKSNAEAALDRYFDKPTLQRSTPLFKILIHLNLDDDVRAPPKKGNDPPPQKYDLDEDQTLDLRLKP